MKQPISHVLRQASQLKTDAQKIDYLQKNSTKPMLIVLQYALHPAVKWLLPEGEVPFKPTETWDDLEGQLYNEARKLYFFVEGGYPGEKQLAQVRREMMFIQLLEGVHRDDAFMLVAAKDKKLPWPGLTPDIIRAAFPGLIP